MGLVPHVGYHWVRDDPKITPGWTDPGNSGNFRKKSGKTGKFRKIQKFACDISNESCWQAGSRAHNRIAEFWKNSRKFLKNLKILEKMEKFRKAILLSPEGRPPASILQCDTKRTEVVDGSNESLCHTDEEMHPLVHPFHLRRLFSRTLMCLVLSI